MMRTANGQKPPDCWAMESGSKGTLSGLSCLPRPATAATFRSTPGVGILQLTTRTPRLPYAIRFNKPTGHCTGALRGFRSPRRRAPKLNGILFLQGTFPG